MTAAVTGKALLPAPATPPSPGAQLIVRVARDHKVSPFKQMFYMFSRMRGQRRIDFNEYYSSQLYRTDFTKAEKDAFVGMYSSYYLNQKLSPPHVSKMRPFIRNKALYGALLERLGLSTTHTQAVATHSGSYGDMPALRTAAEIATFLRKDARYPVFGKPAEGSRSIGSALIVGYNDKNDTVTLGNGKTFGVDEFAAEIHADYAQGFLLQDAVIQHEAMTKLAGPALGSIRIVTVNDGTGPQVLYTVWKVPSPTAMSDNFWQNGSMIAALDAKTGQVTACHKGTGLDAQAIDTHPVSKMAFAGFQIPHWDAAKDLAIRAHALFPEFGVFGWDMGIGQDGPVIVECNANPFHTLYQIAHHRGVKNPDFMPILDRVIARQESLKPKGRKAKKGAADPQDAPGNN